MIDALLLFAIFAGAVAVVIGGHAANSMSNGGTITGADFYAATRPEWKPDDELAAVLKRRDYDVDAELARRYEKLCERRRLAGL